MKYIYLRHGLTSFSVENKFMGRANLPLLSMAPEAFKKSIQLINEHSVDIVLCSPLLRAKQTFDIIRPHINLNKCTENHLLIERDFGLFEGKKKNEKNRALLEIDKSVEPINLFRSRIASFFELHEKETNSCLIISHSAFFREATKLFNLKNKSSINCCEAVILEFP
ncbi:MAG: phosphoglycerate mutase family protein [Desulfobacteraceae bacterium]|nr:phosphoglycerate mutase family protein [Desulfobacteraceae bacterium]